MRLDPSSCSVLRPMLQGHPRCPCASCAIGVLRCHSQPSQRSAPVMRQAQAEAVPSVVKILHTSCCRPSVRRPGWRWVIAPTSGRIRALADVPAAGAP